jgi:radical SAM protein with 4Fe4S-binding SPASM domain
MIGITSLYCNRTHEGDRLRYRHRRPSGPPRPVVVWNATRRCNLACRHCYSASDARCAPTELTTDQARAMIADLAAFGAPVLLLSGGEPLLRDDLLDLIAYARQQGMRPVLSTNGTLIDAALAKRLREAGLAYAGISLDGPARVNDAFRGQPGAFEQALEGIRHCRAAGVKTGLRLTIHRDNVGEIPGVFDLIEAEGIGRVCFYHLVASGRGSQLGDAQLTHLQTRETLDLIMDRSAALLASNPDAEVLTVANHADGAYVSMRLEREDPARSTEALQRLRAGGGNASGQRIACVSWDGTVLPDQFWRTRPLGNVTDRPFSEIWSDESGLLGKLRNRLEHLRCRCLHCRFLDVCNGNMRARAESVGDAWGEDPACYLTDEEIAPR